MMGAMQSGSVRMRMPSLSLIAALVITSVISGSLSALFLASLDMATRWHGQHPWLLLCLPVAGVLIVWFYQKYGSSAGQGNHLLVQEIHELSGKVPLRMAPMVLGGTLITHAFGGSAGREGTAVQMGGAVAAWLARCFSLTRERQRLLLMAGIASGFGAVFGTPWAGAVFAIELPVRGRWQLRYLAPCLVASWLAHVLCVLWGGHHIDFHAFGLSMPGLWQFSWAMFVAVAVAAVAFGLCARIFVWLSHQMPEWFARISRNPLGRPVVGGCLIIGLVYVLGTADYLGLGVVARHDGGVSLLSCFRTGGADSWSWWWKLLFTVITISSGFKGGEVTPLFFIGAALGNAVAMVMGLPVELFAGLGLVAVFAAAANTPLACSVLAIELFGIHYAALFAFACLVAYLSSGKHGIYKNQK